MGVWLGPTCMSLAEGRQGGQRPSGDTGDVQCDWPRGVTTCGGVLSPSTQQVAATRGPAGQPRAQRGQLSLGSEGPSSSPPLGTGRVVTDAATSLSLPGHHPGRNPSRPAGPAQAEAGEPTLRERPPSRTGAAQQHAQNWLLWTTVKTGGPPPPRQLTLRATHWAVERTWAMGTPTLGHGRPGAAFLGRRVSAEGPRDGPGALQWAGGPRTEHPENGVPVSVTVSEKAP